MQCLACSCMASHLLAQRNLTNALYRHLHHPARLSPGCQGLRAAEERKATHMAALVCALCCFPSDMEPCDMTISQTQFTAHIRNNTFLAGARYLLTQHPTVEAKLLEELDSLQLLATPSRPHPRRVLPADLGRLPYLQAIIKVLIRGPPNSQWPSHLRDSPALSSCMQSNRALSSLDKSAVLPICTCPSGEAR